MTKMWMVRAGEKGFLIDYFKESSLVAIEEDIGDLSDKSPDDIKEIMNKKHSKSKSLSNNTNQVISFVHEMEIGEYIISYNPEERIYLVGKIVSDYYYSDSFSKKYNISNRAFNQCRNVEWIGETKRDDLKASSVKHLNYPNTVFDVPSSSKNELLTKMNYDKIEWTEFYMEFADKLLEYKDNREELINKVYKVFEDLNLNIPNLGGDVVKENKVIPFDMDPFTVFALFNKNISTDTRINFVNQIKKEFSIESNAPYTFNGIPLVNNLKATFYWSSEGRKEDDVDNLWNLFEIALNFSSNNTDKFISLYDKVITQKGIQWNITMGLSWIRPFTFINLDKNNRKTLSTDEIFSERFKNEINSLKSPPNAKQYLHICDECKKAIKESGKYPSLPFLSHGAYVSKIKSTFKGDDGGIGDEDVDTVRYWLVSAGYGSIWWDIFLRDNVVGIGMSGTKDLRKYNSKREIQLKFQRRDKDKSSHMNDVLACWQFVHEMQIGDIIFVKNGTSEIIGRGIIESDYEYDTTREFHNIRRVNWTHKGNWKYKRGNLITKTLTQITYYPELVEELMELVGDGGIVKPSYPEYTSEKFLEEVYINEKAYITLKNLLKNKKNIIVQGAPGVGKTFLAKRLAYSIMGVKDYSRVMMVQFHQSYSYEDFVMGYRPFNDGFELKKGSFYKFCKNAEEDSENDYFFIIDEINRGNLSKIFGELFMLIENDKRGERNKIQLLYSEESFFIPKNVYIIGLMNTADRSLAMIDYALRRRFSFFDLKPAFNSLGFKKYQEELENPKFNLLIETMKELNQEIRSDESLGDGFRIGHSYLCNFNAENVEEKLNYVIEYELIPLLKEYWFDEAEKISYWSDRLRSVLDD